VQPRIAERQRRVGYYINIEVPVRLMGEVREAFAQVCPRRPQRDDD